MQNQRHEGSRGELPLGTAHDAPPGLTTRQQPKEPPPHPGSTSTRRIGGIIRAWRTNQAGHRGTGDAAGHKVDWHCQVNTTVKINLKVQCEQVCVTPVSPNQPNTCSNQRPRQKDTKVPLFVLGEATLKWSDLLKKQTPKYAREENSVSAAPGEHSEKVSMSTLLSGQWARSTQHKLDKNTTMKLNTKQTALTGHCLRTASTQLRSSWICMTYRWPGSPTMDLHKHPHQCENWCGRLEGNWGLQPPLPPPPQLVRANELALFQD